MIAPDIAERDVSIQTPDGLCDAYFAFPSGGPHPGVLMWPDGFGLRAAFRAMGARLGASGYAVLIVNPYYRDTVAPAFPERIDFSDPAMRKRVMDMVETQTTERRMSDARVFASWLDAQGEVDAARKLGVIGYCMTGPNPMRTASLAPERVGACASFHGGRMVVEGPDSPHLLIAETRADYLIVIAKNDDENEPDAKNILCDACGRAGLKAEIEVYPALHGFCAKDAPLLYDEAQAERAWSRLLALFQAAL